jgi:hypothetical protein
LGAYVFAGAVLLISETQRFLHPALAAVLADGSESALRAFVKQEAPATPLFSFPVFSTQFCTELLDEIDSFEASGLPVMRPNSMNNYGVILSEIGMCCFLLLSSQR